MAAYAALVSLMHIIEQLEHHPRPPISLDKQQVKLLTEKVTFLQEFLEGYSHVAGYSEQPDALEMRIADAAYAAEDIIESYIVDQIHADPQLMVKKSVLAKRRVPEKKQVPVKKSVFRERISSEDITSRKEISLGKEISSREEITSGEEISPSQESSSDRERSSGEEISSGKEASWDNEISPHEEISSIDVYQGLQKVIEDMDFIKKEVMEMKDKKGNRDQLPRISTPAGSLRLPSSTAQSTMVDFGDILYKIMDKLTGGQPHRQTISIIGMGGIGKTTLALNIYENQVVVQHFHVLAWGTISQEYRMREILLEILLCLEGKGSKESLSQMDGNELGETLYKSLSGRTYLIILDDIWNTEVWDKIKFFFPDNSNGSRIMLTTRLSKLAFDLSKSDHVYKMDFLDEDRSWNLFYKHVFGEEYCPLELKEIGKKIVESCKGLPLAISVIGGLLAKSKQTTQYWEHVAKNLHSTVNLEDNERCLQILYTSYNNLPVQLKPCFLYMGISPEGGKISVPYVIKLWDVEGFIKPICGKSFEEAAEEYLRELIERNLILVKKRNSMGKMISSTMHDLLRDLCIREAQKQKFLCLLREQGPANIPQGIKTERRICFPPRLTKEKYAPQVLNAMKSASLVRSFMWWKGDDHPLSSLSSRLLRVLQPIRLDSPKEKAIFQQVNLRMVVLEITRDQPYTIPSSICLLWNLQILVVAVNKPQPITAPSEIWRMTQLRHVVIPGLLLPDPPSDCTDDIVLENLEELSFLLNFKFDEEVVRRIPNIKTLKIFYKDFEEGSPSNYCLNNLGCLHKLEDLVCCFETECMPSNLARNLAFFHSLKKLTLSGTNFRWEDLTTNIGSLPHLQELRLLEESFAGPHWETIEGKFPSLKFLKIEDCDLEYWTTDGTHFPRLEHLVLVGLENLKEIPLSIGDIPMLQSIELCKLRQSANDSAKRILEEQEEFGNESLQVRVLSYINAEDDEW